MLSILKQTATACTNEFRMFDELALVFPGVPEYFQTLMHCIFVESVFIQPNPICGSYIDIISLVAFLHALYIINLLI